FAEGVGGLHDPDDFLGGGQDHAHFASANATVDVDSIKRCQSSVSWPSAPGRVEGRRRLLGQGGPTALPCGHPHRALSGDASRKSAPPTPPDRARDAAQRRDLPPSRATGPESPLMTVFPRGKLKLSQTSPAARVAVKLPVSNRSGLRSWG